MHVYSGWWGLVLWSVEWKYIVTSISNIVFSTYVHIYIHTYIASCKEWYTGGELLARAASRCAPWLWAPHENESSSHILFNYWLWWNWTLCKKGWLWCHCICHWWSNAYYWSKGKDSLGNFITLYMHMVNHTGRCKELHGKGECNPPQHTYTHKKSFHGMGRLDRKDYLLAGMRFMYTPLHASREVREIYMSIGNRTIPLLKVWASFQRPSVLMAVMYVWWCTYGLGAH